MPTRCRRHGRVAHRPKKKRWWRWEATQRPTQICKDAWDERPHRDHHKDAGDERPHRDQHKDAGDERLHRDQHKDAGDEKPHRDQRKHAGDERPHRNHHKHTGDEGPHRNQHKHAGDERTHWDQHTMVCIMVAAIRSSLLRTQSYHYIKVSSVMLWLIRPSTCRTHRHWIPFAWNQFAATKVCTFMTSGMILKQYFLCQCYISKDCTKISWFLGWGGGVCI